MTCGPPPCPLWALLLTGLATATEGPEVAAAAAAQARHLQHVRVGVDGSLLFSQLEALPAPSRTIRRESAAAGPLPGEAAAQHRTASSAAQAAAANRSAAGAAPAEPHLQPSPAELQGAAGLWSAGSLPQQAAAANRSVAGAVPAEHHLQLPAAELQRAAGPWASRSVHVFGEVVVGSATSSGSTAAAARSAARARFARILPQQVMLAVAAGGERLAAEGSGGARRPCDKDETIRANRDLKLAPDTDLSKAEMESDYWGWWMSSVGTQWNAADNFIETCSEGDWIEGFHIRAQGGLTQFGPVKCARGQTLRTHGEGRDGREWRKHKQSGWKWYEIRTRPLDRVLTSKKPPKGAVVSQICAENDCGGESTGLKRKFECPGGSKLAGISGRAGLYVGLFRFFCGCPKPTRKLSGQCVTPRNCTWHEWGSWSECTKTCGSGWRSRSRAQTPALNGGKACNGSSVQENVCQVGNCPTTTTRTAPCPRAHVTAPTTTATSTRAETTNSSTQASEAEANTTASPQKARAARALLAPLGLLTALASVMVGADGRAPLL